MMTLRFPAETHSRSIDTLDLSVRARNALRRNGYSTLGDLDSVEIEALVMLPHVGASTITEIVTATWRVVVPTSPTEDQPENSSAADANFPEEEVAEHGWVIPSAVAGSPVTTLGLPARSVTALHSRGIMTLDDLAGFTVQSVQAKLGIQADPAHRLAAALEELLSIDPSWLRSACRQADAETCVIPKCGPGVLWSLHDADGVAQELNALLQGLADRDRKFVLARWCYFDGEQPTLDSLATEAGVTRERVRQVVEREEQRLRESGIVLPLASQAVDVLREAGGLLTMQQFRDRLTRCGLGAEPTVIRTFPHLARLQLVPRVTFNADWHLWVSGPGEELLESGRLPSVLHRVSRYLGRQLRTRSCIDIDTLPAKLPFGADHALKLAQRRATEVEWVGSYGIPVPLPRSKLTNAALKLLAVSPSVSLEQAYNGLTRALGPAVPPPEVLTKVLALHPRIAVEQDRVRASADLDPEKVLSPAERTAVALFAAGGNVLLAGNFIDGMVRSGFSVPMASVVLRRPFVRRIGAGIYGLRGRAIHRDTVRARIQERSRERNRNVVTSEKAGSGVVVRYRLTRFSLGGVLAQPKELRDAAGIWTSRFPDGGETALKIDNGFVWTILPWLRKLKGREGDFVVGTFDPVARQVDWAYERADQ